MGPRGAGGIDHRLLEPVQFARHHAVHPPAQRQLAPGPAQRRQRQDGYMRTFARGQQGGLAAMGETADGADDAPDATMNLVWNFGVESEMTDWATLRLGYATMYDAGGGANTAGALQGGLGFNYDSFQLDMNVDVPALVHDPVVYMTGRNQAPLGAAWTVTYSW